MTTELSLKAESECTQYYLCLISEDVETIYHKKGENDDPTIYRRMHRNSSSLCGTAMATNIQSGKADG
jgi:hypothetical protein